MRWRKIMLELVIGEQDVFTHSMEELSVFGFYHRDGRFSGDAVGPCWSMIFSDITAIELFKEQLEFILDGNRKGGEN
jgi:hypothetical protein